MEDEKKIGTSAPSQPEDDDELETEEKQKRSTRNNGSKQEKKTPPKFDVHWRPSSFTEVKKPNGEGKQTFTDMKKKVTTTEKTTFLGIKEGEKIFRVEKTRTNKEGGETTTKEGARKELKADQPKKTLLGSSVQEKIDKGYRKRVAAAAVLAESTTGAAVNHLVSQLGRQDVNATANFRRVETKGKAGEASAAVLSANAGAYRGTIAAGAYAGASIAKVAASSKGLGDINFAAASANAEAVSADANAEASVLGVSAGAGARVAKVEAGIAGTPLHASASFLEATSYVSAKITDLSIGAGASLAEATAGPIGVRAGLAIGAGIKGGMPFVDLGPVRCCIQ